MILRRLLDARTSLAAGLAVRIAAAALVVCVCVFALVYARFADDSYRALLGTLDTDLAGLVDIYDGGDEAKLAAHVNDRLSLSPRNLDRLYYRLEDASGRGLAGNLSALPAMGADRSEARLIRIDAKPVLVRVTVLKGGLHLAVGRSGVSRAKALSTLLRLFVGASLLIVLAAFAVGLAAAGALKRRVAAIDAALHGVQTGRLSDRVAERPGGDEVDQLGRDVNRMLDRVENLIAAQRDVTDNIAHETRTPLMQLDASLMKALDATRDPRVTAELEKGRDQIRGMLRLYDALLDIATTKGQSGDTASLSEIDLSAVAHSLAELYRASAEEAGLIFAVDIAPGVVCRADAMQMSHLMVNLLDNAFKYGADGGYIGFALQPGPVVTVADRGPGIAPAEREAVFRRYHRTRKGEAPGHGLGLALVKAIATRHALKVRVEDFDAGAASPGARFVVWGQAAE